MNIFSNIYKKIYKGNKTVYHNSHLIEPSIWPAFGALGALVLTLGFALVFNFYSLGPYVLIFGVCIILMVMFYWWKDIVAESLLGGSHTLLVQVGLRLGVILFIISEIMFFYAYFWAFFHSSLAPTIEIGCVWPPEGLPVISPFSLPLANTLILLSSGLSITLAHHDIIVGKTYRASIYLFITLLFALLFIGIQGFEYSSSGFDITDGIYGSTFFMLTGFHGFHVMVGTVCITVGFCRILFTQFRREQHIGLEAAIWYWHFVDVVWLFLYLTVYWWGWI